MKDGFIGFLLTFIISPGTRKHETTVQRRDRSSQQVGRLRRLRVGPVKRSTERVGKDSSSAYLASVLRTEAPWSFIWFFSFVLVIVDPTESTQSRRFPNFCSTSQQAVWLTRGFYRV